MKKLFLVVGLLVFGLMGCGNHNAAYSALRTVFPSEEIVSVPGESYEFIIRKADGDVLFVSYNGIYGPDKVNIVPILLLKGKGVEAR